MPESVGTLLPSRAGNARNDLLTGGILIAACVMLVGSGGSVLGSAIDLLSGIGGGTDRTLAIAVILNVALILFGWRRYRDLSAEIAERGLVEQRAETLAMRDPLTGFYNRRAVGEQGAEILERAGRRGKWAVLLMLDLDHFKHVNDMHGHGVGDSLLKAIARAIGDLLPPSALPARLGGDEFACIFVVDHGASAAIERVADAVVTRLGQPFEVEGTIANVSVSCGIAVADQPGASISSMMRRADIAMYAAKQGGRNRFAWFDQSMERELEARTAIEEGLRVGIPRGEFVPYFEQQIDLTTGRLHGFEMLARWNHPTKGLVAPDLFIPVAEESGVIGELSLSVMRQALVEAKDWDPGLTIAVNIAPMQLKDPWLAHKIVRVLAETNFPPHRLEVEITESSLFENLALAQSTVASLKNQGIRLALDDFGTGYSSLAHLRALPFDRIKIDRSFVTSILDNAESAAIVGAIARLGDSLNLPVTAEGIEDAAIEARLRAMGCARGQGYLYGRPMSVAQVRRMLAEKRLLGHVPAAAPTLRRAG